MINFSDVSLGKFYDENIVDTPLQAIFDSAMNASVEGHALLLRIQAGVYDSKGNLRINSNPLVQASLHELITPVLDAKINEENARSLAEEAKETDDKDASSLALRVVDLVRNRKGAKKAD